MYEYVGIADYKRQEPSGFWSVAVELLVNGEPSFEILKFVTEPTENEIETTGRALVDRANQDLENQV